MGLNPEDPQGPIEIPPAPVPTQPNSVGLDPPTVTVIWGKRQEETDPNEDPEDPQGPIEITPAPVPTQPNSVVLNPPTATVIWGKRQDQTDPTGEPVDPEDPEDPENPDFPTDPVPDPPNSIGIEPPTVTVIWGKRQDDSHTIGEPQATVIWGKRQDDSQTIGEPQATVIWGKRDYPVFPPHLPKPTPVLPTPSGCAAPTATLIPVCEPPKCPARSTPCDLNRPVPRMEKRAKREIEKRLVTIETVAPPVSKCTVSGTKTVVKTCPTYTCVPGCEAARVVR
jgi:hypothetical protein